MLERILPFAHNKINEYVSKEDIVIDMTAGNGNDTMFLASLSKKVYAFDIQKEAISNTRKLLEENNISNVELILDSHINVQKYVNEKIQCAVFNLGHRPNGNPDITTTASTTISALNNLFPLLKVNGLISVVVYVGHKNGETESALLNDFVSNLPSKTFDVGQYSTLNKKNAPYNILIEKIGE
jgi:tRNA G37 N-methylase Trm5